MKKWCRQWKLELIEAHNPDWLDLYPTLTGFPLSRE
jgi:putative endonuclease